MPIYEYVHDEPSDCRDFEIFQKMADEPLEVCPKCGAAVHKKISKVRHRMQGKAPPAGKLAQQDYGLARGEQGYIVPSSGEMIHTEGMTKREKQVAIWQGHQRAGDSHVANTGPEVVEVLE